jgi:hypothetical protein
VFAINIHEEIVSDVEVKYIHVNFTPRHCLYVPASGNKGDTDAKNATVRSEHFNMELMIEKAMVAMICLNLMVGACVWMCKFIIMDDCLQEGDAYAIYIVYNM